MGYTPLDTPKRCGGQLVGRRHSHLREKGTTSRRKVIAVEGMGEGEIARVVEGLQN